MSSPAELRKMLTHAIHQYGLTITAEDAAFWRQRIARLKQALARDTLDGGRARS